MDSFLLVRETLHYLATNIPWDVIAASGILSPVLLLIKKWFSVQSEKVMITLVGVSGLIVAGLNYITTVPTHDPSIIAFQGAVVAFLTQPFYFYIVKPIATAVSEQLAKDAFFKSQVQSAAEPSLIPADDFSQ
jgi:hypothetical protein